MKQGIPGWFTKVAFHYRWIKCIINMSVLYGNNMEKVNAACKSAVNERPKCPTNDDLIFGNEKDANSDVDICTNGGTVVDNPEEDYYDLRNDF